MFQKLTSYNQDSFEGTVQNMKPVNFFSQVSYFEQFSRLVTLIA